jgi:hypothetical protein
MPIPSVSPSSVDAGVLPTGGTARGRLGLNGGDGQARELKQLLKEGTWDDGRNLPLPDTPSSADDLDAKARAYCLKHDLSDPAPVKELLSRFSIQPCPAFSCLPCGGLACNMLTGIPNAGLTWRQTSARPRLRTASGSSDT